MDISTLSKKIKNDSQKPQKEDFVEVLAIEQENHHIVLYNDEVNTFDFVIESLMEICDHTPIQAEQCTFLVHFKGKCDVKSGSMEELMPKHQKLLSRGLTSEIV